MQEDKSEECGIIGVVSKNNMPVARFVYNALVALQHRGQDAAGFAILCPDGKIEERKGLGLVREIFREEDLQIKGSIGIGHTRYPTTGRCDLCDVQPSVYAGIAVAHNGHLANYNVIKERLAGMGRNYTSTVDSEPIAMLLDEKRKEGANAAVAHVMAMLDGAYSDVAIFESKLLVFRDPHAIRPLVWAENEEFIAFASETVAFDINGMKPAEELPLQADVVSPIRPSIPKLGRCKQPGIKTNFGMKYNGGVVGPGEMVLVGKTGNMKHSTGHWQQYLAHERIGAAYGPDIVGTLDTRRETVNRLEPRHCMFEYVYFSRPDSVINNLPVHEARKRLGQHLAKEHPAKADVVVPVPDTSRQAAQAYAHALKLPVEEGLIKNRYIGRTFIMPDQQARSSAVRLKLNAVRGVLEGKRVVLIDDSIVRGTTLREIVGLVREAGAGEVHLRITCPPIKAPCFYGVDMSTYKELVANRRGNGEICAFLGADTLGYLSLEGLRSAIGMPLCTGCLDEDYPTAYARKLAAERKNE